MFNYKAQLLAIMCSSSHLGLNTANVNDFFPFAEFIVTPRWYCFSEWSYNTDRYDRGSVMCNLFHYFGIVATTLIVIDQIVDQM